MDEIIDQVNELLEVNVNDLAGEILRQSKTHSNIQRIYLNQVGVLNEMNTKFSKLKLYRWQFYAGKLPTSAYTKEKFNHSVLKTDIDKYLDADNELCTMKEELKKQEALVKFLEDSLKRVSSRGYEIKAAMDWQKFIAGS